MARALSITLSICSSLILFSQPYLTWANYYGLLQDQIGVDIHWTPDGGLLSTGTFEVQIAFNAGHQFEALGERDVYVLKQDQNGGVMWAKHFGTVGDEEVRRIDVNDQGDILLSIAFSDTLTIDTMEFVSRGLRDVLIMRMDHQGEVLHTYHIESGGDMEAVDMAWVDDGSYMAMFQHRVKCFYTVGGAQDSLLSNGARDMGIMCFSASDSLLWTHSIGGVGPSDHGQAIVTDDEGHYYIYGHFRETVDFDPGPGVTTREAFGSDVFLAKYTLDGDFVWTQKHGENTEDKASDMVIQDDKIYLTGLFKGPFDALDGPGEVWVVANGHYDAYTMKMGTDGSLDWIKSIGDESYDQGLGIDVDAEGNVYTVGNFTTRTDLDPGIGVQMYEGNLGGRSMFIQKLDSLGDLVWADGFTGEGDAYMEAIEVTPGGRMATTGRIFGATDIAPNEEETLLDAPSHSFFAFTALMADCLPTMTQDTVSACEVYLWEGMELDSSGTYTVQLLSAEGCDSTRVLDLTILPSTVASIQASSCDTVEVNGISYDQSGIYEQVLMNDLGCDSILEVEATVHSSYLFSESIEACGAFIWNGVEITSSGEYEEVYTSSQGCDSSYQLIAQIDMLDLELTVSASSIEAAPEADAYQWLDCDQDFLPLDNEDSSLLQAPYDGSFAVMITDGVCVDTTECITVMASSLFDLEAFGVDIFPNPVRDRLNIENLPIGEVQLTIMDISGRRVMEKQIQLVDHRTVISTDELPSGVYTMLMLQEGSRLQATFIKE